MQSDFTLNSHNRPLFIKIEWQVDKVDEQKKYRLLFTVYSGYWNSTREDDSAMYGTVLKPFEIPSSAVRPPLAEQLPRSSGTICVSTLFFFLYGSNSSTWFAVFVCVLLPRPFRQPFSHGDSTFLLTWTVDFWNRTSFESCGPPVGGPGFQDSLLKYNHHNTIQKLKAIGIGWWAGV